MKFLCKKDLDLLKFKKCAKEYINFEKILSLTINKLIIFDTPMIIGKKFPTGNNKHIGLKSNIKGKVENLVIRINSLDVYGKNYKLKTYKTYEILLEMIELSKYNSNITFEMSALSKIMKFLAFEEYKNNQIKYNNPNDEEDGEDYKSESILASKTNFELDKNPEKLPNLIFCRTNDLRDKLRNNSLKINALIDSNITIKTATIKNNIENYEYQKFLSKKMEKKNFIENENKINNDEMSKMDFGSDEFDIERDYKIFFSLSKIKKVKLINVFFSNNKDSKFKEYERETIINLLSDQNELSYK